jgi:hypothetical protein
VLRLASWLFAVAAALLAFAAYLCLAPARPAGRLIVDRTPVDFGSLPAGEHRIVVARVRNTGDTPRSILGVSEKCGHGVCYWPAKAGLIDVPAGGSVDVECVVSLHDAGPVRFPVLLYLDNGKFDHDEVEVRGVVLPNVKDAAGAASGL